ncbi:MAG: porin family protein [Candidatus Thiodubiliella endoseptemdiera]|uniref:Porin family protein n=1 Tax=Candidatus Thiodubiliella endoseptemdiera TaxID=2738886 RepID=A0A853F5X2_9GAMM|nr:porin family protein [Candidatus Thiodubiliella endoseptemdiera]
MKNKIKIAIVATLLSSSIFAQSDNYFGIGVYQTKYSESESGTTRKYKKNNYKALLGTHLDDNWSVEGQYTDFATDSITENGAATVVGMSGTSLGLAGLYHFNPQVSYSPFVKLGWHFWDFKITNTTTGVSKNVNGDNEFYGVGVDGKINETMKYRVELERMKTDGNNLDNIGVALLVDF